MDDEGGWRDSMRLCEKVRQDAGRHDTLTVCQNEMAIALDSRRTASASSVIANDDTRKRAKEDVSSRAASLDMLEEGGQLRAGD